MQMIRFTHKPSNKGLVRLCLIGIFTIFTLTSCYTKYSATSQGSTTFVKVADNGNLLILEVQGAGANSKIRKFNAISNAIKSVVLYGIPGSTVCEYPMASADTRRKAESEIKQLMESGEYARFINYVVDSDHTGHIPNPKSKGLTNKKQSSYSVGINLVALRRHFENEGAIRKFGL